MSEKIIIPASIIIAAAVIVVAIMFSNTGGNSAVNADFTNNPESSDSQIKKVDPLTDHIQGSPDADLFIVEYSDLECPFCKRYHENILKPLVDEYAADGRISFVFRHFPLDAPYTRVVHATAKEEAVAAECVAKQTGDEGFFKFIDEIFATTESKGTFDLSTLGDIAERAGADPVIFQSCYDNNETEDIVTADFNDGRSAGVEGTPAIFAQDSEGNTFPAVADLTVLKQAIDIFLEENPEQTETSI